MKSYRSRYLLRRNIKLGFSLFITVILLLFFGALFFVPYNNTSALGWAGSFAIKMAFAIGIASVWRSLYCWSVYGLRIDCPECHKSIRPSEPWRCGFCDQVNKWESVGCRCRFCHRTAPTVRCANPDCHAHIPLEDEPGGGLPAIVIRDDDPTRETPSRIDALREEREAMEIQVDITRFERTISEERSKIVDETTRKSVEDEVQQAFEDAIGRGQAIERFGAKYLSEAQKIKDEEIRRATIEAIETEQERLRDEGMV